MSITSALYAGASGLIANSASMAAISDNIANTNTTAYKRNQVNFSSLVTAQLVEGRYGASGVGAVTRQFVTSQGLIQAAASPTDIAIGGAGFFVVTDKAAPVTNQDPRFYTRSGSFNVDADGFLVNDGGYYLQGWLADVNGTITPDPSDLNQMQSINIKNVSAQVIQTTEVIVNANLDKRGVSGSVNSATYNAATTASMSDYAVNPATGTRPDFTFQMNVIDSSGGTRRIAMSFLQDDANPNSWYAEIHSVPATEIAGSLRPGQIASGLINFNTDGTFNQATSTLFGPPGTPPNFTIGASSAPTGIRYAAGLGIDGSDVDLNLTNLTQFASLTTVNSLNPNGSTVGAVLRAEVAEDGKVSAIFDNGQIRLLGQIGIATFPNPDGLDAVTGNAYVETARSGEYSVKQPQLGGAGSVESYALEASNVDLATEFTNLIVTQRAYSASSKIITTSDQMLDELINIKR